MKQKIYIILLLFIANVATAQIINTNLTVTVGQGGNYATLADALDSLSTKTITQNGYVTISLLAGDHIVTSLTFNHPQGSKIKIKGATMKGAIPIISDMTGDRGIDSIFVRSKYATCVYLQKGSGQDFGLNITGGIDNIENIAFFAAPNLRYPISIGGFSVSWTEGKNGGVVKLTNTTHFGGVWGFVAGNSNIIARNKMFFAYQTGDSLTAAGGAMILRNSQFQCELYGVNMIQYYANSAIETPKNFCALINSYALFQTSTLKVHGVETVANLDASTMSIVGAVLTNCGQLGMLQQNSQLIASGVSCTGFNGSRISNASNIFNGYGIGVSKALLFLGFGCTATLRNLAIDSCKNTYLFQAYDARMHAIGVKINNCKWTLNLGNLDNSVAQFSGTLTNSQAGSINNINVLNGSNLKITGTVGIITTPELGTFNANAIVRQ